MSIGIVEIPVIAAVVALPLAVVALVAAVARKGWDAAGKKERGTRDDQ